MIDEATVLKMLTAIIELVKRITTNNFSVEDKFTICALGAVMGYNLNIEERPTSLPIIEAETRISSTLPLSYNSETINCKPLKSQIDSYPNGDISFILDSDQNINDIVLWPMITYSINNSKAGKTYFKRCVGCLECLSPECDYVQKPIMRNTKLINMNESCPRHLCNLKHNECQAKMKIVVSRNLKKIFHTGYHDHKAPPLIQNRKKSIKENEVSTVPDSVINNNENALIKILTIELYDFGIPWGFKVGKYTAKNTCALDTLSLIHI